MGWERNNFDRVIHFSYGLLLAYPIREVFQRIADVSGFWGYFLPLDLTMSTSMAFELIEWGAAEYFGGDLGMAYLGIQGDVWDAQWDMFLALCGAAIVQRRHRRDQEEKARRGGAGRSAERSQRAGSHGVTSRSGGGGSAWQSSQRCGSMGW